LPGVDDVTATMIVQPPGGIDEPAGNVISVVVVPTPTQVPVFAETMLIPTGIGSLKGAVRVKGPAPALPSVMVMVARPPIEITAGTIAFVTEPMPPPAPVTVIGALAGGALPPLVLRVPVMLVTVPVLDEVIVTTIAQPPAGIAAPLAIVIVVAVTATSAQVPALPPIVVTPAGIASTNGAASVSGPAFALESVIVSAAVPPTLIVAGAIAFVIAGPIWERLSVSEAVALEPVGISVTVTMFVIVAVTRPAANDTGMVYVRALPAPAPTRAPVTVKSGAPEITPQPALPAALQVTGPLSVTPVGNASLTDTLPASELPVFVTTMVYVPLLPGT
jgi:hypothetical protein